MTPLGTHFNFVSIMMRFSLWTIPGQVVPQALMVLSVTSQEQLIHTCTWLPCTGMDQ